MARDRLTPSMPALLLQMFAGVIMVCKILDNIERLRLGMDNENIPLSLISVISASVPLCYIGIIILFGFSVGFIAEFFSSFFEEKYTYGLFIIVLFILTPAMLLTLLETSTARAAFSPRQVSNAMSEIGMGSYITALLIAGVLAFLWWAFVNYLVIPGMQQRYFWIAPYMQEKMAENLMAQLFSGKGENELSLPVIVYGYSLMGGLVFMLLAFFNHHFYATFFPREDDEDGEYGMDISDREGITATLAEHGVSAAPQAEKKAAEPLPDFSLLTDADTSNMGIETQKAFALALARADALLTSNKIDAGLELLAPFADETHDAAAYFPA